MPQIRTPGPLVWLLLLGGIAAARNPASVPFLPSGRIVLISPASQRSYVTFFELPGGTKGQGSCLFKALPNLFPRPLCYHLGYGPGVPPRKPRCEAPAPLVSASSPYGLEKDTPYGGCPWYACCDRLSSRQQWLLGRGKEPRPSVGTQGRGEPVVQPATASEVSFLRGGRLSLMRLR